MPPSVGPLIAARLDLLAPEQLWVLQRAAVVGLVFERADVQELGADIGLLPELEEKGFVRRIRSGFRFHHVLVRDVAYASLPKAERAELHEQLADWLGERGEVDELVGYHLEQAYGLRRELGLVDGRARRLAAEAGARLGAAGIEAWKRGETPATVNLLGRATELLPRQDLFRLELLCELGPAFRTGGDLVKAEETLAGTVETAAAAADRRLELRARLELSGVHLVSHQGQTADELLDIASQGLPVFEAVGDDRALGRAWRWISHAHGAIRGRHAAAAEAAEKAVEHHRRSGWPVAASLGDLAVALHAGPTPAGEAIRRCRKLLAEADLAGEARIVPLLAGLVAMRGDFAQARELAARGRTLLEHLGQASVAADVNGAISARIELLAGDFLRPNPPCGRVAPNSKRLGDRASLATRAAELGDVLCLQRRDGEAETWCGLAEKLGAPMTFRRNFSFGRSRRECWHDAAKPVRQRRSLVRRCVSPAETDGLNNQAKALIDLSEVLQLVGRSEEAWMTVQQAMETFESKGNTVAARRAKALLAELPVA